MRYVLHLALGAVLACPATSLAQGDFQGPSGRRPEFSRRYPVQPWWWSRWGWYPTPVAPPASYANPPGWAYEQSFPSPSAASIESIRALAGPNRVSLEIIVPEPTADVLIEGQPTTLFGTTRYFVSPYLEQGKTYHYTVTMKRRASGKTLEETRKVEVKAGVPVTIDFTRPVVERLPRQTGQ